MSEKESKFMNILTAVLGGFILALTIGLFSFYQMTIVSAATQDMQIDLNKGKIEIMRIEIREDLKEIKMNIDRIAVSQIEDKANRR